MAGPETAVDSELGSASGKEAPAEPSQLAAGTFVGGRYRVVRFIARGGMGEVYEAFDEELRVRVALKLATHTSGRALDRFRREVMLARRVTHRNVCRLFEIGFEPISGGEVPFCTMELLEGATLADRLASGPLALDDARAIVDQIAAGLGAAHDVGVIHRDFKSSNILLVRDGDGRERAVITDFGLARAEAGSGDGGATLTTEQALLGTPAYMAPEQVECKPVTAATDIYALGIVMFELVTGELPFRADTPMATAVLRLKQPAPSARSRRPEISPVWDRAIARCLELDPARRFARAADVASALDDAPPRRAARWALAAGLASAGVLALVLGHGSSPVAPPAAALPAPDALSTIVVLDPTAEPNDPAAWRTTAAGELLRAELRVPGRLRPLDGDQAAPLAQVAHLGAVTPAQLLVTGTLHGDRLEVRVVDIATGAQIGIDGEPVHGDDLAAAIAPLGERLRRLLAADHVPADADRAVKVLPQAPEAARRYAEGLALARAHDHQGAIAALTRATELAPDFGPAYLELYGEQRAVRQTAKAAAAAQRAFELAGGLRSDQRLRAEAIYRESRKEWKLAAELWSTLAGAAPDDLDVAAAYARSLASDHQVERCYEVLDRLRVRAPPVGDDPRLDLQEAACAREAGDFRRGLSAATRADVKAGVRGERDAQASALAFEGEMLANAGEYDRAISVLERARELSTASADNEAVFEAIRQLAFVRAEQGKTADAEQAYREARELAQKMGDRLAEGIILNDLGQIRPQAEDALALFREGLAIAREQDDERLTTALLLNVANKQDETDKADDAVETYREVIARATAQQDDENLATAEMNLGNTLVKLGRRRESLPLVDRALESFRKRGDEDGVGFALASRGDLRWRLGDLDGARVDLEAALAQRTRLGEQRNVATSQVELARLDLAEDQAAAAEPLARAALAQRRTESEPERAGESLITLARALVALGRPSEALAAVDEAERLFKPDPAEPQGLVNANDIALVRALVAPEHAADQLAIIRAAGRRPRCPECAADAVLREAEVERAAGHAERARALLADAQRRARAAHANDLVARATRLLASH